MPGRPSHSAQRAIQDLTLGVVQSRKRVAQRDVEMGLREVMQQFQSAITGTAQPTWAFRSATVTFDYTFYYAPGNRDNDLERPQFWFGLETDADILVQARVKSWVTNEQNGGTTGAVIRVGFMAEAATDFDGVLHLTFQGFGDLADGDSPDDDLAL